MSRWNRLFSYFPLLMTVATFAALGVFARVPSPWSLLLVFAVIYILPPVVQRVMFRWAPLKLGVSTIDDRSFSSSLAAHHIQAFYDALPQLESLLRVIPGFYSMWLRLWGSRVGYGVEWPVRMDVLDRNLMD
ncbi:MAG: acyl transferase, partial [Proteobacteria bacterium]|nr:acyl transferase [Pseudomonadota bacterium]